LPVVTGAALVVKHPCAIFLVFDPLAIVLVAIQILIHPVTVFFAIEPPTSVHFFTRVYISAIAVLLIVFPLTLVSGAIAIVVDTTAGFKAFRELAFELVAVGV
jgi:hypothetical protein